MGFGKRRTLSQLKREVAVLKRQKKIEDEIADLRRERFRLKNRKIIGRVEKAQDFFDNVSRDSKKKGSSIKKFGKFSRDMSKNLNNTFGSL